MSMAIESTKIPMIIGNNLPVTKNGWTKIKFPVQVQDNPIMSGTWTGQDILDAALPWSEPWLAYKGQAYETEKRSYHPSLVPGEEQTIMAIVMEAISQVFEKMHNESQFRQYLAHAEVFDVTILFPAQLDPKMVYGFKAVELSFSAATNHMKFRVNIARDGPSVTASIADFITSRTR